MKSMIMEVSGNRRGFVGGRILRTLSQQSEQKPIDDIKMDGESFSTKNAMANDKHEVNIFIHAYLYIFIHATHSFIFITGTNY